MSKIVKVGAYNCRCHDKTLKILIYIFIKVFWTSEYMYLQPTSVAQLYASLTGDQEVMGATFFRGYWSWNIFYGHSLPLIQEVQLSVSGKRMCTILVNRLED